MKILMWPAGNINCQPNQTLEYLTGQILHGLRSILEANCVDFPRYNVMYQNYPLEDRVNVYGRSFNLACLLEDIPLDRENIPARIQANEFQWVIVPIHCTAAALGNSTALYHVQNIRSLNARQKIFLIDTLDQTDYICPTLVHQQNESLRYFKRERLNTDVFPIDYCIPKEKVVRGVNLAKTQSWAQQIPWISPPIFNTEADYNWDYQKSFFGFTCKKGGFNSFRTLEIMANGCLPYFTDIDRVPEHTLTHHNKELYLKIRKLPGVYTDGLKRPENLGRIDYEQFNLPAYNSVVEEMLYYIGNNLTTECLAKRLLTHME